ncbi:MAG: hypothetical protein OHK0039_45540 [Bacteroidia bacterium]
MPYLSLLVNTGSSKGYFQMETFQDGTKWGIGQTSPDYLFDTQGEWVWVHLMLTPSIFSKWDSGPAEAFDPTGVLDYVKIGFTTGNVADEPYEISVDAIYLSDQKMW